MPTQQELDQQPPYGWPVHEGVPTWDWAKANIRNSAFQKIIQESFHRYQIEVSTEQQKRRSAFEPLFVESVNKICVLQGLLEQENRRKGEQDAEELRLKKLKEKYLKDDENERLKVGG